MKYVSRHQDLETFVLKLNNKRNFYPLKVVGRGSETQLQVGDSSTSYNIS